ncbi:MAG: LysR family transcriptional regulator [Lachnospiraceae bacterium]|nr:LysR family transcriptional regulator [Lachnospiraceae bacterium]
MTLSQLSYVIAVASSSSMNEASKKLFISQPSISATIRELEEEIGINIFIRSNRGISLTPEGEEFVGYAKQVVTQYELIENKYITGGKIKKRFSVSAQHYAFAVDAFAKMVEEFGMDGYDFAMYETKTYDVIQDVKRFKSEIGILYLNDFNRKIITKLLDENELEFHPLLDCGVYAYMWKKHPLAKKKRVTFDELNSYPCIIFEQGSNNSFYFAEEMFSTYQFNQTLRVCDRATGLNLMIGLNAFTVCSGIICEHLNGSEHCAVKLDSEDINTVGYIVRKGMSISPLGQRYIDEISKYKGTQK